MIFHVIKINIITLRPIVRYVLQPRKCIIKRNTVVSWNMNKYDSCMDTESFSFFSGIAKNRYFYLATSSTMLIPQSELQSVSESVPATENVLNNGLERVRPRKCFF